MKNSIFLLPYYVRLYRAGKGWLELKVNGNDRPIGFLKKKMLENGWQKVKVYKEGSNVVLRLEVKK